MLYACCINACLCVETGACALLFFDPVLAPNLVILQTDACDLTWKIRTRLHQKTHYIRSRGEGIVARDPLVRWLTLYPNGRTEGGEIISLDLLFWYRNTFVRKFSPFVCARVRPVWIFSCLIDFLFPFFPLLLQLRSSWRRLDRQRVARWARRTLAQATG